MTTRRRTIALAVPLVLLLLCLGLYWDAIPGTFYNDSSGFPHGTGQREYFYDNGALMVREKYFRGLLYQSTWFKPDGQVIASENYHKTTGGVGYYLRQDGTIESKHKYEYSPADNAYVSVGEAADVDAR